MAAEYDVIVLGSGPGGYVAAIRAAQLQTSRRATRRTSMIQKPTPFLAAALALSGCAMNPAPPAAATPAPPGASGVCDAAPAQAFVGQQASSETGAAIQAASGASLLRWGPPRAAWTMDYRQTRVNVRYDDAMTIIEITCG